MPQSEKQCCGDTISNQNLLVVCESFSILLKFLESIKLNPLDVIRPHSSNEQSKFAESRRCGKTESTTFRLTILL